MTDQSNRRRGRARDRADVVAFNQLAPADERKDALAELQKSYMPTANDLAPMGHLKDFMAMAQEHLMTKAIDPNIVDYPSSASIQNRPGMKSVQLDEFMLNMQGDYWERPSLMSFDSMRNVVDQVPILSAVVLTRMRQVQRFCAVSENGNDDMPGYEIRHMDKEHKITKSEQENVRLLNRFIMNCGWESKPRVRKAMGRDAFPQFMGKLTRDTLSMDAAPIELEWKKDRKLGIAGFYAVDGATIRLCTDKGYRGNPDVVALQVVQGRICTAYTNEDLIYEARNPRSNVLVCGYGHSEVEMLVKTVTGYLNAMTYNIKGFDSNSIPKGMMHLVGKYDDKDIASFRRYWNAMVKGVNNAWALPVLVSPDEGSKASFEKFDVEFNEMYFAKWMTFLTSLICAIYGISPAEVNFDSFSGGSTSPLAGSDTEEKLVASKDSGLRPLLSYFQQLVTDYIVREFSDDLAFRFTGLDPEDQDKRQERIKLTMTVDEMRARDGLPQHKDKLLGAAPTNPALMQVYMASAQQQGLIAPPEAPGGDGEGGDQGDDAGAGAAPGADPKAAAKKGAKGAKGGQEPVTSEPPSEVGGDFDFGKAFGLPVYQPKDLMP